METFPKKPDILRKQVDDAENIIDDFLTQRGDLEAVVDMSHEELKKKFPRRYAAYVAALRNGKRIDNQKRPEQNLQTEKKMASNAQ